MWEVLGYLSRLPAQASVAASQLSQPRGFLSSAEMSSGIDGARGSPRHYWHDWVMSTPATFHCCRCAHPLGRCRFTFADPTGL